jgi:hypothetical protein
MLSDGTPFRPSAKPMEMEFSKVSKETLQRYKQLFLDSDTDKDGYLSGDEVRAIWLKSGLDIRSLGLIWNLADLDDDGRMNRREFCLGMFIIDEKLRGCTIPTQLDPKAIIAFDHC